MFCPVSSFQKKNRMVSKATMTPKINYWKLSDTWVSSCLLVVVIGRIRPICQAKISWGHAIDFYPANSQQKKTCWHNFRDFGKEKSLAPFFAKYQYITNVNKELNSVLPTMIMLPFSFKYLRGFLCMVMAEVHRKKSYPIGFQNCKSI